MEQETEMSGQHATARNKTRNPAIEICRLVAAIFVVFIHYGFPGEFGNVINCLARFSVSFFFVVSGYFVYHADESVIKKRVVGILKLNIYASMLYVFWGACQEEYFISQSRIAWLTGALSNYHLSRWLLYCQNPFAGHLWYLAAILTCYIMIWVYARWINKTYYYRPLYIISISLFAVHFVLSSLAVMTDLDVPRVLYRNAWFFGIPMFSLGIFIREYQDRMIETYKLSIRKLMLVVAFGAVLSVIQWRGIGKAEIPFGTVFEVIALMLLLVSIPSEIQRNNTLSMITSQFGSLSTYIYVTHLFWKDIYVMHIENHIYVFGEFILDYLSPIFVVLLSACTGVIWIFIKEMVQKVLRGFSFSVKRRNR